MSERKRVLAARLDAGLHDALAPALGRSDFDLNLVPAVESAIELVRLIAFEVILVGLPAPDDGVDDLLAAVRAPGSPSRLARLLLFAPPAHLAFAESRLARGADQALSSAQPPLELQEAILRLLRARPRLSTRVMARLTVRLGDDAARFLCQTRDLSRTGMLAVTENRYPLGTPVRFVLDLPGAGEGVEGDAEVVRQAERARDGVEGLGLHFLQFRAGGDRRLFAFLAQHGA